MTSVLNDEDINKIPKDKQTVVIFKNKVYDVSKFVHNHPGGSKILTCRHGKDVTDVMVNGPHEHSDAAYKWLEQYYIADYSEKGKYYKSDDVKAETERSQEQYSTPKKDEDLVDWEKPMLWQVGNLGQKYHTWIDVPVDKPLRLFESDIFEYFSNTPWYVVPLVWIPVTCMFLLKSFIALQNGHLPSHWNIYSYMMAIILSGIFMWTFLEYSLHRWVFHATPPHDSYFFITMHFLFHGQHHKVPFDAGRLVFPVAPAGIMLSILYSILVSFITPPTADSLIAGVVIGYVAYDLTHYYIHYGSPSKGSYYDRLRSRHMKHHFQLHNLAFGISSSLWDYPFGTTMTLTKKYD